jgi:hypothetical protein
MSLINQGQFLLLSYSLVLDHLVDLVVRLLELQLGFILGLQLHLTQAFVLAFEHQRGVHVQVPRQQLPAVCPRRSFYWHWFLKQIRQGR